jgi:hypothetical protein
VQLPRLSRASWRRLVNSSLFFSCFSCISWFPSGDAPILDVNDDEARALLLSIDPVARLAALGQTQQQLHDRLLELAPPVVHELRGGGPGSPIDTTGHHEGGAGVQGLLGWWRSSRNLV